MKDSNRRFPFIISVIGQEGKKKKLGKANNQINKQIVAFSLAFLLINDEKGVGERERESEKQTALVLLFVLKV